MKIRIVDRPTYGYVIVELTETSAMNGYCTNAPMNSDDTTSDLKLLKSDNPGSEWSDLGTGVLKYTLPASYTETTLEFTVYVRAYDYGAWGKLKATLYEKTGENTYKKRGSGIGTVPRDENGNHIADGWENDFYPYVWSDQTNRQVHRGNTKSSGVKDYPYSVPFFGDRQNTVDNETGPTGNTENGDGFTVFEEYRGFMTEQYGGYGGGPAGHTRTSPATKDVFYVISSSMSTYGIGAGGHPPSFTEMHAVCVNEPWTEVWDNTHTGYLDVSDEVGWINSNSDGIPDTEYVHALRIKNGGLHPQDPGNTFGLAAGTHKPYEYSLIYIYVDGIAAEKRTNSDFTTVSVNDLVVNVISHEVGHMINLDHCSTACLQNHPKGCVMDPYMSKYALFPPTVDHYPDYDLAGDVKDPKTEAGSGRKTAVPPAGTPTEPTRTLAPASGSSKTATAGDSHTANFSASSPYSSVYWYVKSPTDTSANGRTIEIDQGNGSLTTASFTYTFPSGVSGDYKITSYVYPSSGSVYEDSYTVSVSIPPTFTPSGGCIRQRLGVCTQRI